MSQQIAVPDEMAAAIDTEAIRRCTRRTEVLREFVKACWPAYVAEQLRRDLADEQVTVRATWAEPCQTPEVREPNKALGP